MTQRGAPPEPGRRAVGIVLAAGTELGGYRIESLLGRGGMGVVYRALDLALDRKVALKLLAPELAADARFRERFLRESRLAASLDHPAIVPIYDAGEVAGHLYIAMRLVEGGDLKRLLAAERELEPERALRLLEQVADALDAAHERGLVHRDVKPSNVLIDERDHSYLADFGLSRRLAEPAAGLGDGRTLGTIDYVAPEQIRGEDLDGRADLYSLGCLLYECLAGRPPFVGSDTAIVFAHLQAEPLPLPRLESVIKTALAKDPNDRYQTGRELIEAARRALGIARARRSGRLIAVAAIGAVLIVAALIGFVLTRDRGGVQAEPGVDSLVRIDPSTDKVVSTMPVGRKASGVAAFGQYVWVTSFSDGTVLRIDRETGAVLKIPVRGNATGVAAGPRQILVANGPQHSLASIDPVGASVSYLTQLPGDAIGDIPVASGEEGVWFADPTQRIAGQLSGTIRDGGTSVSQLDVPADESGILTTYESLNGLAVGEGAIWASGDAFAHNLWRLDPRARRSTIWTRLPFVPGRIAAGEGAIWVASSLEDSVWRIDPASGRVVARISVPRGVGDVAVGGGAVWVVSSIDRVASRIDPKTNQVVARVPTSGTPTHLSVGRDGVWITTTEPTPAVPPDTVGIGVIADCTGPYGSWYDVSLAGAELVLLKHGAHPARPTIADGIVGARIAGKPVSLVIGCTDRTATSALAEARRLVEQAGVRIVIGPTYASQELALQRYARQQPEVAFINGAAGAQVLDPARNFFAFNIDAAGNMAGLGTYAYRTLGWRRVVTVTDMADGVFNWTQAAGFTAEFCSLGGTIAKRIAIPTGTTDYSGLIARIPSRGVDGFVTATGPQTVVALAKQYPGLRGDLSRKLVVGTIAPSSPFESLGTRTSGVLWSGPWLVPNGSARTKAYLAAIGARFPRFSDSRQGFDAGSGFDVPYHDAMEAATQALAAVHGELTTDGQTFMAALARVRLSSPTGPIRLDRHRQAISPNYLARASDNVPYRRVDRVEHTFGGYFTAQDGPPSATTPACRRHSPPPWTH